MTIEALERSGGTGLIGGLIDATAGLPAAAILALLMDVAVAASSAFLTLIGHQNGMVVMGPGRYRFADYWRLGLPLSGRSGGRYPHDFAGLAGRRMTPERRNFYFKLT